LYVYQNLSELIDILEPYLKVMTELTKRPWCSLCILFLSI